MFNYSLIGSLELSDQDKDLGGVKESDGHHFILMENLEKNLCPLTMMDFLHERTLITAQAYVFPSSLAETYARGAILVDSRAKLKRIYEFINNPNHFIVSSSGRLVDCCIISFTGNCYLEKYLHLLYC